MRNWRQRACAPTRRSNARRRCPARPGVPVPLSATAVDSRSAAPLAPVRSAWQSQRVMLRFIDVPGHQVANVNELIIAQDHLDQRLDAIAPAFDNQPCHHMLGPVEHGRGLQPDDGMTVVGKEEQVERDRQSLDPLEALHLHKWPVVPAPSQAASTTCRRCSSATGTVSSTMLRA